MSENFFSPRRFRRSYLAYCFLGAISIEGAMIGVAQLWPTTVSGETGYHDTLIDPNIQPGDELPPLILPKDEAVPTPEVPTPTPEDTPTVQDTPPLETETIMTLDTPKPTPPTAAPRRMPRPTRTPSSPTAQHGDQPQSGVAGGTGPATNAVGAPGGRSAGARPHTPRPPYPFQARSAKLAGSGVCRVTFDGAGRVASAVMTQSVGNALLDSNTVSYARENWSGQPNTTVNVPVTYQLH